MFEAHVNIHIFIRMLSSKGRTDIYKHLKSHVWNMKKRKLINGKNKFIAFNYKLFVTVGLVFALSATTFAVPLPRHWGNWKVWGDMGDGTYRNPVLPSDYSDLDCIRVGSDYYAISSTMQFCPGMIVLHSRDLVNWEIIGHAVFDTSQIGPGMDWDHMNRYGRGVWAGAIRYHGGKFWVYFGTPEEGYFMTTATNPAGLWAPLHCLKNESGWDDCCPFWDDDGQAYFVGTRFADNYKTYIWKMSSDGSTLNEGSRTLINEGAGREASKLYKINGWYYHFYSEVLNGTRVVMMQRSQSIMGPYTERRQLTDSNREWKEPNQGGLVVTESGDWFFLTHHGSGDWAGRCMSLLPVTWIDGWPIMGRTNSGEPGKMVLSSTKPVQRQPVVTPQSSDDFSTSLLSPQWEWNYHPRMDKWSLTERPGFLRLKAFTPLRTDDLMTAGNTLTQRTFRTRENVVIAKFELSGMVDGQKAGLCHFASNHSVLGVAQEGSVRRIEFRHNGVLTRGPIIEQNHLWIKSSWGLDGKSRYAYSLDGQKFTPFGSIYQLSWGYYRGDRIGLYSFNNKEDAGYVDVDFLNYEYTSPPHEMILEANGMPVEATSVKSTSGIMLGSWNTQVEYDNIKIASGGKAIFSDSFDIKQSAWYCDSGDWKIAGGVFRQMTNATPALATFMSSEPMTNYTISVRAKKIEGAEGFLVGFGVQDSENFYWLNLGGWNNSRHQLEKNWDGSRFPIGPAVNGTIETSRWYDVRIEVWGEQIVCFLGDRKIIETRDSGFTLLPYDGELGFGRPLIPDLVADPSIVDINGTFYCYVTTDGWGQHLSTSGTPVVWTSRDFVNWSFEGSIFSDNFDAKYWAPSSPIKHHGRYYLFPTLDGKITATVSDSLTGPFKTLDGKAIYPGSGWQPFPIPQMSSIDAEIFRDDDGQLYMFYSRRRMVKLKPDLSGPDGPVIAIDTGEGNYSEGPWVFKRKGIYYYLYTLGGGENYSYAYLMSHESPIGPWTIPTNKIIAQTDPSVGIFGPGHGCFVNLDGTDDWYFIHLEFGRSSTNRQIFAQKMTFNEDGTIQVIKLTNQGVGAIREVTPQGPNLALDGTVLASSVRPDWKIRFTPPSPGRIENFAPDLAIDDSNGTRWMAAPGDENPWFQVDLGKPHEIQRTEAYFVKPAVGHSYKLKWSLDGQTWQPYGGNDKVILRSPHCDAKPVRARYLKLTILHGEPGLWEFRVY